MSSSYAAVKPAAFGQKRSLALAAQSGHWLPYPATNYRSPKAPERWQQRGSPSAAAEALGTNALLTRSTYRHARGSTAAS